MGARTIPRLPQHGGFRIRSRFRPPSVVRRLGDRCGRLPAPSPLVRTLVVLAAAVAFVAALTYYGADEFSRRAADARAATEATSLARLTGRLATADAYDTYLEMLRYADDPSVRARATAAPARTAAMQQLLYLNTNNLTSLTVADRSGTVLAATAGGGGRVLDSIAYQQARGSLAPANTDVLVPGGGGSAYIEFAVPLRDVDGTTWGVLLGRADPAVLWKSTLGAAVDGSRGIVINSAGLYAAGVPAGLLGQPWRGQPLDRGGVRADIAGVASICGLSRVGQGSPIDRGFSVASCLPSSLVRAEHGQAIGKQGSVTLSGAVLAVALAGAALYFGEQRQRPLLLLPSPRDDTARGAPTPAEALSGAAGASHPGLPQLLEGYERRNERLSERLREEVRPRLLLASSRADDAWRRNGPAGDASVHDAAMAELEEVRDRELRVIEQELYPAVVRLGLPNALKSLRRDLAGTIDLTLELDPLADAVDGAGERSTLALGRRLVLYRLVLDSARALAGGGATDARVSLRRLDAGVALRLETSTAGPATAADVFATAALAVEAYGGSLALEATDAGTRLTANFADEGASSAAAA
ncbi:MAG: cache domain-containing protein [Dehalococcoidia bacterium]|nr:cache domain-containing protein [Dehalococcoidia bacterium]